MRKLCRIDFHTHIDHRQELASPLDGVLRIVSVPIAGVELTLPENTLATLELHPWNGEDFTEQYSELAADQRFIGIGEVGLDRLRGAKSLDEQLSIFRKTVELAGKLQKPLTIHCVKCFSELLNLYKLMRWQVPTVIHYYRSNLAQAQQLWQHTHFVLSLPPAVYTQKTLLQFLRENPSMLERTVLETDDPHHGDIIAHYRQMADFLAISEESLQKIMQQNFERIYHAGIF